MSSRPRLQQASLIPHVRATQESNCSQNLWRGKILLNVFYAPSVKTKLLAGAKYFYMHILLSLSQFLGCVLVSYWLRRSSKNWLSKTDQERPSERRLPPMFLPLAYYLMVMFCTLLSDKQGYMKNARRTLNIFFVINMRKTLTLRLSSALPLQLYPNSFWRSIEFDDDFLIYRIWVLCDAAHIQLQTHFACTYSN